MNVETENYIDCDECGGKMMTHMNDRDNQGNIYCRECGLVYDPEHEMGSGISGLETYMKRNRFTDNQIKIIRQMGLKNARLYASKL